MGYTSDKATKSRTVSTSVVEEKKKENRPPKGATIIEESTRTRTEEIENGWLVTKTCSGRYKTKDSKDGDYGSYFDYDTKWFSKEDPLTITLNDKSLAEAFEEEGE